MTGCSLVQVDIGTEWNLKELEQGEKWVVAIVDIGTEWNLKGERRDDMTLAGSS